MAGLAMTVLISQLPRVVETLRVNGEDQFVILPYDEFVKFVVAASAGNAPNIVSILDFGGEHAFVIIPAGHYRMYIGMLDISGEIDDAYYLGRYEDVNAAVARGEIRSGTQHYLMAGYFERRDVR